VLVVGRDGEAALGDIGTEAVLDRTADLEAIDGSNLVRERELDLGGRGRGIEVDVVLLVRLLDADRALVVRLAGVARDSEREASAREALGLDVEGRARVLVGVLGVDVDELLREEVWRDRETAIGG